MEVSLNALLAAREQRVLRQRQLLEQYRKPLVCFTMNIAGPVKNNALITAGFQLGQRLLLAQLPVIFHQAFPEPTGCEGYYIVDGDPLQIKRLTVMIEDSLPAGRLFDMDVLSGDGQKITRQQLGLPGRKCLLCDGDARVCGRSRSHSVEALQAETTRLLQEALWSHRANQIGALAARSLLQEVCTTPKPGLVDQNNSGSHRDMDLSSFFASTAALQPYFIHCAYIGRQTAGLPATETFRRLRLPGLLAEQDMYEATGGVNTHKGAIFTLGLLCGAAGRLESTRPDAILAEAGAMVQGLVAQDFAGVTVENAATTGQRLYALYGITGVRGQAEQGFPAVAQALPVLEQGLAMGLSLNDAGCAVLLHLIAATEDTNLIARSNLETQRAVARQIAGILKNDPYPAKALLLRLDQEFINRNLSPGGSADLLAATYFLHWIQ